MATTLVTRALGTALAVCLLAGCSGEHGYDHGDEAGHGHGHAEGEAGDEYAHAEQGGGRAVHVHTDYTDDTELFLEFPALVAGEASRFAAHVTRLVDYSPLAEGVMDVRLQRDGTTVARFRVTEPSAPGLFTPVVRPRDAGVYTLSVRIESSDVSVDHVLGEVRVVSADAEIERSPAVDDSAIEFGKEAQWQGEFGTRVAEVRRLRATVYATAELQAPGDRTARVRATADGQYAVFGGRFPVVGSEVEAGERLGTLRARLAGGQDLASLRVAVERALAQLRQAREDVQRLSGLLEDGAIAAYRVREARSEAEVAAAELDAARSRIDQYRGGSADEGVPVIAPIAGQIVQVDVAPGEAVAADQVLFHIAAGDRRWLATRIAEADADRLRRPTGAWFTLDGERRGLDVGRNARLVTAGGVIDPVSRTVPVVFEFDAGDATPVVGRGVDARVYTGETVEQLAVPRSAIIDDSGQNVVFIQVSGEHFERRAVRLGLRGVDHIAVEAGLAAGERIVDRGAYQVRLAGASSGDVGHGHSH